MLQIQRREPRAVDGGAPVMIALFLAASLSASLADLQRVNAAVNRDIVYGQPYGLYTEAHCYTYVAAKQQRLLALGWAPSDMRVVVLDLPRRGYRIWHVVLAVRTLQGERVLDSLWGSVTTPEALGRAGYRPAMGWWPDAGYGAQKAALPQGDRDD